MAKVEAIHIKTARGCAMEPVASTTAIRGQGLEDDIGANALSPRQVLVVRSEDLDAFALPFGYLRENISLRGLSINEFIPGSMLVLEDGVEIFLGFNCEPCKTIALRVPHLKSIMGRRGLLGIVVKGGRISTNEQCLVRSSALSKLSDLPADRVLSIIKHIPSGKAIDYPTLLVAAGLQGPYFRVMPKYLAQSLKANLPGHRVVDSALKIPLVTADKSTLLIDELTHVGHKINTQFSIFPSDDFNQLRIPLDAIWQPHALHLLQTNLPHTKLDAPPTPQ